MKNRGKRIKKGKKREGERERERESERKKIPIRAPNIKRFFRIGRYISPVIKIPVAVKFNKSVSRIRVHRRSFPSRRSCFVIAAFSEHVTSAASRAR